MTRNKNISSLYNRISKIKRLLFLFSVSLICSSNILFSQILNNAGVHITTAPGVFVTSGDLYNNLPGNLVNDGTITLFGDFTSTTTTSGNGTFTLMGNWTNTGGTFSPGPLNTVIFDGLADQAVTRAGGENFRNFTIRNTGVAPTNRVEIFNDVEVIGTLAMERGIINAGTWLFYLSNPAAAALNYTSTTGSRILGKFERGVSQAGNYLFPMGTINYYNPANLRTNSLPATGTILSEYFTLPPANVGFPIEDYPVEIGRAYNDGYWSLIAKGGFSISDFNINLNATGFVDTIHDNTRLIRRITGGSWIVDGTHQDADTVNKVIYRNNLNDGISATGTQFALGRARPLIMDHPNDTTVCEETLPFFKVVATGTPALRYTWYKVAVPSDFEILNSNPHFSGARTDSLTILGATLADTGYYYCIVRDRYSKEIHDNVTRTDSVHLTVKKIPQIAITSEIDQNHECSNLNIDPVMFSLIYWDDVTTYNWVRDNPAGITASTVPISGTNQNISDVISGSFTNTSDEPVKIIFTIIPYGPDPTYCEGDPVIATVMVNPTPRVIPVNRQPAICNDGSTEIELTTPTLMTKGGIVFDYNVTLSSGDLTGNTTSLTDLGPGYTITLPYHNAGDTLHSVFYTVTPRASDGTLGCVYDSIRVPEVKVHPDPLQDFYISTPFVCEGGSDGALTAVLSRGSKPDDLTWTAPYVGETTETTTANTAVLPVQFVGNYHVMVEDELGCTTTSSTIFVAGAVFDSYLFVLDKVNGYGTTCPEASDGELWIKETSGSTGVPPYVYTLIYNNVDTIANSDTLFAQESFNYYYNLRPGYYRLYLNDANGCYNLNYPGIEVTAPPVITVEFDPYEYSGGYNISCLGYSDGSVKIDTIYGGNGGYTYKWTTSDGTITGPDTMDHIDNLTAGTYYLTTTDMMGCIKVDSITLTQPDGMVLSDTTLSISRDGNYNISCNSGSDGTIDITITGGSGTYLYSWTGPAGYPGATTRDISGLKAGTYTCIVTDVNGCILTPNPVFTLTEPAPLGIAAVPSSSAEGSHNINCYGGTGSVDITVTGGSIGTYIYTWSTTDGSGIAAGQADQNVLTAGTYHLEVSDTNNCSVSTDIALTQPQPLGISLVPAHITCVTPGFSNGSVALTVTGGVSPFSYSWSNGAVTEDISGLTAGSYIVTVTDMNGCTVTDTTQINLPPPVLYDKVLSDYDGFNASCYGMSNATININMTGGQTPFTFSWTGPGYTSSDRHITGIRAGDYTLVVTDANFCTATEVITVTQPGRLHMDVTLSSSLAGGYQISCAGDSVGSIELVPVNNIGTVRYLWSDGSTSGDRNNLPAGDYGVIITDSNGCLADSSFTLTEPDPIALTFETTQPWCPDLPEGEIRLTVTGGVMGTDYSYRWSDNSTNGTLTDINSGLFWVTVTDMNMCTVTDSINLEPVNEACLLIPNAISPNGDLINDEWNIGLIEIYPEAEIRIFNRWGETVWRSEKGYPQPWDGRSNGRQLPVDSYHYIIDLNNGTKPVVGNITIVR
ncbi:MAG: gliding motility-associated C-terminal domain-containing protein [Bacteroidota bacterium]